MAFVFEDPVTLEVMKDAVVTSCGHSFSQETIEDWLETKTTCPLCNTRLTHHDVKPNYALRDAITHYLSQNQQSSLEPNTTTTTTIPTLNTSLQSSPLPSPSSSATSSSTLPKGVIIKEIHPSDGEDAASVLEQAFRTSDPFVKYFYPTEGPNAIHGMKWFLTCMVDYGVRKGRVWGAYHPTGSPPSRFPVPLSNSLNESNSKLRLSMTPQEICGASIWQPPFESGVSMWEMMKSGMVAAPYQMGLRPSWRLIATLDALEKKHRQSISGPHWSLYSIGIVPSLQNMGIGTNLVSPILKAADAEQMPIYLDTPSERSLRFFGRLGFHVVTEYNESKMPPFWCLVRQPLPLP